MKLLKGLTEFISNMLKDYLYHQYRINRFHNSWIIESADIENILFELQDFIIEVLLPGEVPLANHPDFKIVEKPKSGVGSKVISVEQIRILQEFLNKTSCISTNKVAVIFQADLMNPNAANSCLKILEDTGKNTYIFLITSNASIILPTIQSRCLKFKKTTKNQEVESIIYKKNISFLIKENSEQTLVFLKELSDKNRVLWNDFTGSCMNILSRIIKKLAGADIELNNDEVQILSQLKNKSMPSLIKKFESLNKLICNTMNYDLDIKASFIIAKNLFEN